MYRILTAVVLVVFMTLAPLRSSGLPSAIEGVNPDCSKAGLIATEVDDRICIWSAPPVLIRSSDSKKGVVQSPRFSPSGKLLAYADLVDDSNMPSICIARVSDGACVKRYDYKDVSGSGNLMTHFCWLDENRILVSKDVGLSGLNPVWLWSLQSNTAPKAPAFNEATEGQREVDGVASKPESCISVNRYANPAGAEYSGISGVWVDGKRIKTPNADLAFFGRPRRNPVNTEFILYGIQDAAKGMNVWSVAIYNSRTTLTTFMPNVHSACWSADGKSLVAVRWNSLTDSVGKIVLLPFVPK